ncbi:MAG: hypothetical protein IPP17_23845 [Bacteroidetes bacterium]|nr:hypothetical protein [Bacteroidota bacterium]
MRRMLLFLTIYPIGLKGGEVFKFMATETENVCGDAAEATAELAANESEHPTPVDEVAAVEAAEEVPDEFGQQMGNAAQVEGLEKEGQDQEDAKSDPAKKAMLDQLDEDTPTNLGELKDYNPQNTAGEVTSVVGGEVGKVKQTFGKIEQDAKPMDTPDAVELKPVPSAKDTAKLALGQDAVPAIPEEMSNMNSYQDDMDAVMAEEGITEEQMAMVDSGPLAEAQQGRAELREKVANAPTEMQEGARKQAKTVESEMDKEEDTARTEMKNKRKDNLENVHGEKQKTKTKLEEEREKVTKQIQSMYQTTEDNVKTRLNNLEKENEERFAKAVVKFTEEFKTEVDTKVNAFLDERHSGWFGWARAAKDWLLGVDEMPEVKEAFETANEEQATKAACENPLKSIDTEIKSIIQYNNKVIQECKADLKKGKEEEARNTQLSRNKFVKTLKPNLQDAGKKAAVEMSKKFDELDTFINEKQKALVDKLCAMKDKAIEHIDKVAEKMKEALSGALSQLIGLIVAALLKFFNWALGLFGYGMENLEETIVRTKRTLTFMVKHPIDFMAGLFQAVGMGFTQFGDNIQKHLVSGLVMWLTGGMREEPIRLPDKWV